MKMIQCLAPVIEGRPYPKAAGAFYGYRCRVDGEWHDCDKYGNIKDLKRWNHGTHN